ncbi:hypothetical protein P5673_012351 [Acropora cervicornis]|uniref:Uncharacterized protein n=1 Tax=Acropora cervicornis TaxID=6130 RepID=A0AAD9QML8_ACRCE|nr:hypothetical protein P5673_012351 [Acropora cervicornis]
MVVQYVQFCIEDNDSTDKEFRVHCHDNHDSICENFDTLRNVIRDIEEKAESKDITCDAQQRGDLLYDVKKAKDWFAVLSINENLLHTNKAVRPSITEAYLRSGEAGCYYNNFLIAALKDVGQRAGINIRRYDFSEQQHGKDMCDRILCPMKATCKDSVTRATTSHLPVT